MASYISSYFGSGNTSQPYQGQSIYPSSSTWSTVSSRISTLRKALTKGSEEDDPDNEDCSHVSNVLRAYYIEKGRPFPEWLPPDPKHPVVAPVQQQQYGQYGGNYPGQQYAAAGASHNRTTSSGRGGLSDLWDSGPSQSSSQIPQSLRAARPSPQAYRSSDSGSRQSGQDSSQSQPPSGLRPGLPSQRSNSYQNTTTQAASNAPALGSRDRLRARLQGTSSGRSSPAPTSQLAYGDPSNNDRQAGVVGGAPQMSASQPWSANGGQYDYEAGYGQSSSGYGNSPYRQRPGQR